MIEQTPPFERRVIQRIVRGMRTIKQASEDDNPALISESYRTGFNANMCEELADLVESTTDRIRFEFEWSPEWTPPSDVSTLRTYEAPLHTASILRDAANGLRKQELGGNRRIDGLIIGLKSEHDPTNILDASVPRQVFVRWDSPEYGPIHIRIVLEPEDYLQAVESHKRGDRVSIDGVLEKIGRYWTLTGARNLAVLGKYTSE
jgi:hypothetical protein